MPGPSTFDQCMGNSSTLPSLRSSKSKVRTTRFTSSGAAAARGGDAKAIQQASREMTAKCFMASASDNLLGSSASAWVFLAEIVHGPAVGNLDLAGASQGVNRILICRLARHPTSDAALF